jgi:hypothetical protein
MCIGEVLYSLGCRGGLTADHHDGFSSCGAQRGQHTMRHRHAVDLQGGLVATHASAGTTREDHTREGCTGERRGAHAVSVSTAP